MLLWRLIKHHWDLALSFSALISIVFLSSYYIRENGYRVLNSNDLKMHTLQELIHFRLNADTYHYSLITELLTKKPLQKEIQASLDMYLKHLKGLTKISVLDQNMKPLVTGSRSSSEITLPLMEQQRIIAAAKKTHKATISMQFNRKGLPYFALVNPLQNQQQNIGFIIAIYDTQKFINDNFPSALLGLNFSIKNAFPSSDPDNQNIDSPIIQKSFSVKNTPFQGTATFTEKKSFSSLYLYLFQIILALFMVMIFGFWRAYKNRVLHLSSLKTLRTTLDTIPTMTCFIDPFRNIQINNKMYTNTFGGKGIHSPHISTLKNIGFDFDDVLKGKAHAFEQQRVTRYGQVINLQTNLFPYKDNKGEIIGAVMMAHDITHYKKVEEALTEEKEYASYVVAMSPDMIISLNTDGYPLSINPATCDATGYAIQDLMGNNFWELLYPLHLTKEGDKLREQMNIGQARNFHTQIMTETGQEKTISWNSINRYDTHDNILEIILVGNDITTLEEKEYKERERQKMEALGQLAGGVAHELNNLLQPIILFSEIELDHAAQASSPHPKTHDNLKRIIEHAERSSEIVDDILTFARKKTTKPHLINVTKTGRGVLDFVQGLLPQSIKIDAKGFTKNTAFAYIRETDLLQVLTNLTNNASHAMNKNGKIHISLKQVILEKEEAMKLGLKPKEYVVLTVSDSGCGIEEAKLPHIFEPFFTTKAIGEGTGLGLSIVYGIVKDWSGIIDVQSVMGKGTDFIIYIPLSPAPEES